MGDEKIISSHRKRGHARTTDEKKKKTLVTVVATLPAGLATLPPRPRISRSWLGSARRAGNQAPHAVKGFSFARLRCRFLSLVCPRALFSLLSYLATLDKVPPPFRPEVGHETASTAAWLQEEKSQFIPPHPQILVAMSFGAPTVLPQAFSLRRLH